MANIHKNLSGKSVTTEIISVAFDSRQVSKTVRGLRSVLNKHTSPPTGRQMFFVTQANHNDTKCKIYLLSQKNHKIV